MLATLILSLNAYATDLQQLKPPIYQALEAKAVQYGASLDELTAVMLCESAGNQTAYNPKDPNGGSHGLFQFQVPTFNWLAKESGVFEPDINNPYSQIEVAAYAFGRGEKYKKHWACYRQLFLK